MKQYEDRLKDYVDVKTRVAEFYRKYPDGRLVTGEIQPTTEPDGVPRIWVQALAYRTADDPHPAQGWSWMVLPGSTSFTRGSELENTETSAWGRAIGALGIGIEKSIASANEIAAKDALDTGLTGLAITQGTQDGNLRKTKDGGWALPFRVKDGSKSFIVLAENQLAETMDTLKQTIFGSRVTVWGHWTDEVSPARGTKPEIRYRLLHLERIQTPEFILPATKEAERRPEPVADPEPDDDDEPEEDAVVVEAPTEPLGLA